MITWKLRFIMLQLNKTKLVNFRRKKPSRTQKKKKKTHKKRTQKYIMFTVLEISFILLLILSRTRNMLIKKECRLHSVFHIKAC